MCQVKFCIFQVLQKINNKFISNVLIAFRTQLVYNKFMTESKLYKEKSENKTTRNTLICLAAGAAIVFVCTDFESYYSDTRSTVYDNPNGILPDAVDVSIGIPFTDLWTDRITIYGNPPVSNQ